MFTLVSEVIFVSHLEVLGGIEYRIEYRFFFRLGIFLYRLRHVMLSSLTGTKGPRNETMLNVWVQNEY